MEISQSSSNTIWQLKGFAIFTVFFAHMPAHSDLSGMVSTFNVLGAYGVPIFLLLSGFFDFKSTKPLGVKIKRLFIPLLIWGTITYIIHIIKTPFYNPIDYFKWVYGCGSWLYFVPVLFWCQLLTKYINSWVLFFIGITSMILSMLQVIPYNSFFTLYTNPFNFIVYFIIGRFINKYSLLKENFSIKATVFCILIVIVFLCFSQPTYYSVFTMIFTVASFVVCYKLLSLFSSKLLINAGKFSFVIYLCHIQTAGAVDSLSKFLWGSVLEPLKVVVAFIIVYFFCYVLSLFLGKVQRFPINSYLGFR